MKILFSFVNDYKFLTTAPLCSKLVFIKYVVSHSKYLFSKPEARLQLINRIIEVTDSIEFIIN